MTVSKLKPADTADPLPDFVNKVLLEYNRCLLFAYGLQFLLCYTSSLNSYHGTYMACKAYRIYYLALHRERASLVAQTVKRLPAMQEKLV